MDGREIDSVSSEYETENMNCKEYEDETDDRNGEHDKASETE
jgi:hypothetical protein